MKPDSRIYGSGDARASDPEDAKEIFVSSPDRHDSFIVVKLHGLGKNTEAGAWALNRRCISVEI